MSNYLLIYLDDFAVEMGNKEKGLYYKCSLLDLPSKQLVFDIVSFLHHLVDHFQYEVLTEREDDC